MIILIMGVSGSGKTTIGQLLAAKLGWEFQDADAYHSPENVEKMRSGIPLTDQNRQPWLQALRQAISEWLQSDRHVVLACSALKASYRQLLGLDSDRIKLVYLKGSFDLLQQRLQSRQHHYMSPKLLQSQFDTLEEPIDAIVVDTSQPPEVIVTQILKVLS